MFNAKDMEESGVLLVDKPVDWTSHDVVNCVRRRFKIKKVGHCGTLDPNATGLLILVLGKATKLSNKFMTEDKVYSGTMRLGIETSTEDAKGEILREADPSDITEQQVLETAAKFIGEIEQVPPMVSAVKVNGQELYKLARKGIEVEREKRKVTVHSLKVVNVHIPDVDFLVHCSKGFYVRTLCADMGSELACGAHLHELRRLRSGTFNVEDAYPVDEIKTWEREELFKHKIGLAQLVDYLK